MSEATGSIGNVIIPPSAPIPKAVIPPIIAPQQMPVLPVGTMGISRDTWAKVLIWFIPVVFACGTIFYSFCDMDDRVGENTGAIKMFSDKQSQMYTEQQVHVFKLDAIQTDQSEIKNDIESVDGKLDKQSDDLSAIKAKLGVKERRGEN